MDWFAGSNGPVRLIEHSDRKEFGTGFAIYCDETACWLVTCAHVADTRESATLMVGNRLAEVVANGRAAGRDHKIDLAVLKVPGLQVSRVLTLAPLTGQGGDCCIPGWSRHSKGGYRGDCLRAGVDRVFPYQEEGSSLIARAYDLAAAGGKFQKGHSGAPAICNRTAAVFAILATREEQESSTGSAICISYLRDLWPEMPEPLRRDLTVSELGAGFEQEIAAIFADLRGVSAAEIRALCRRSAPAKFPLDLPAGDSPSGLAPWLLDRGLFEHGRHVLYDALEYLRSRPGVAPLQARIDAAMQRLQLHYAPAIVTDPLLPPLRDAAAALIEIVFEPRASSETAGYEVHSYWHPATGEGAVGGPRREHGDGDWLDLRSQDQVLAFACELFEAIADLDTSAAEVIFQFRLPDELLFHPCEHWPEDACGPPIPIGRDYPVVVGARQRRGHAGLAWPRAWAGLRPHLHEPLCSRQWCPDDQRVPTDLARYNELLDRIDAAPCILLTRTPEPPDPRQATLLALLLSRGVPILLWPRCAAAEAGLREALEQALGGTAIADLPFAVRDQRRQALGRADAHPLWTHLTLFWDDPSRTAVRPPARRFFGGLGAAS